jgi:hypothetical protein
MEEKKSKLTLEDFISNSNVQKYNENIYNGSKTDKFRKQVEYGERKRIKP